MTLTAERFWSFIDQRGIVRRVVLGITLYLTWVSFHWAASYASESTRAGMDIAAIIAAVLAPIAALQGAAFKAYLGRRNE